MTAEYLPIVLSLAQGIILVSALLFRRENPKSNRLLAAAIVLGLYCQWTQTLKWSGAIARYPLLLRTSFPANLTTAALFYLYTVSLTTPSFRFERKHLWNLLPFFLGTVWYFLFSNISISDPRYVLERYSRSVLTLGVWSFYLAFSIVKLGRFERALRNYLSNLARLRLRWLKILLSLLSVLWVIGMANLAKGPGIFVSPLMITATTVVLFLMGLFGLRQSAVFFPEDPIVEEGTEKFEVSAEKLEGWKSKLEIYMEKDRRYLDPDLRLKDIAEDLGTKPYVVSQMINQAMGTTFYHFVNQHRIEEAKRKLKDSKSAHMNILGIANECGFNSKSVFNETFRRFTGVTPSAFRKSL